MRFCAVLGHYPKETPGGAEYQAYLIARELAARGHDAHYVAYRPRPAEKSEDQGVAVHYLDCSYGPPEVPPKIIKAVDSINPTHTYFRNYRDLYILKNIADKTASQTIFNISHDRQCHSLWSDWGTILRLRTVYQKLKNPRTLLQRRLLSVPDHLFAQTVQQQELLEANHSLESHRIGNGHPAPDEIPPKPDPPIVLWLASLKKWKQPEKFLDIAERCVDLDCRFWLVGRSVNDDYTKDILKRVEELENVTYHGGCDIGESNEFIGKASLFLNTSVREGFPNTFIQSWLHETPVVSLNVDPDGVLLEHDIGGIVDSDFDRMVEMVRELVQDTEKRVNLGTVARQFGLKHYTTDAVVDRIEGHLLN